jgi:phage host-nuclease inhibitor protein Gam
MAAKTGKAKAPAVEVKVPQSRDETADAIREIGEHQRERTRIEAAMNDEIAGIKQKYEEQARPHGEAIAARSQGVQIWCEANRALLTQDGKVKTANLASGEVKWRLRPPSVKITGVDAVISLLKQLKLKHFVRVKEEVDKEAILADPDAVAAVQGIKIEQKEDFAIEPFETKLEEVLTGNVKAA